MRAGNQQKFTFTSYVNCTKSLPITQSPVVDAKLLSGEIGTVSADVFMFPPTTQINDENKGIAGKLIVTNFKLSFIPFDVGDEQKFYQHNRCLRKNDVTLSNIDIIYQIVDKKKKKILPQQKVNSKVDALYIICKNFRFLKFSFKVKDQGTLIASALARFAFPTRPDLSFAFYYKNICNNHYKSGVTMFNTKSDWIYELKRCGASEWKVVSAESAESTLLKATTTNSETTIRPCNLPKYCVIPKCFKENEFFKSTSAFHDSRSAFWVYSYGPTGASLVRMGELISYEKGRTIENVTLEKVRNCDPNKKSLEFKNLSDQFLPTTYDIRHSYLKFRELCTPDSLREFLVQDTKFCSLLDKTGWLKNVSACLKYSLKVSEFLRTGTTVVLQESNAREMCCVISSITQILLDPYFRSFNGFQSLIQKEWIALEHPFSDRLGHLWKHENILSGHNNIGNNTKINNFVSTSNNPTTEESPLLLLFLDCVWQLLQQYPTEFEFSQIYLTTIWDSAFMPIFDTFQFNCEYDRHVAVVEKNLVLRSVWDWDQQFEEEDRRFFFNPLYSKELHIIKNVVSENDNKSVFVLLKGDGIISEDHLNSPNRSTIPKNRYLVPYCGIPELKIWQQCYYRWIPKLEIERGGFSQIDLFHRLLTANISKLERALSTTKLSDDKNTKHRSITNENEQKLDDSAVEHFLIDDFDKNDGDNVSEKGLNLNLPIINSFFPFSAYNRHSSKLIESSMHTNEYDNLSMDQLMITQIPD